MKCPRYSPVVRYATLAVALGIIAVTLGVLMAIAVNSAAAAESEAVRADLLRLAWLCLAVLCVTLVLMGWMVFRLLASRIAMQRHEPTPYVNIWAEAGRRLKVPPADSDESGEDDGDNPPPELPRQ